MTDRLEDKITDDKICISKRTMVTLYGICATLGVYTLVQHGVERMIDREVLLHAQISQAKEITPKTYELASTLADNMMSSDIQGAVYGLFAGVSIGLFMYHLRNKKNNYVSLIQKPEESK
jgi:hypothetical protein